MKKMISLLFLLMNTNVFASHPHDSVCVVKGETASHNTVEFFLQFEVARTYVHGDPNEDVHEFTYQARVCDDDISLEDSACSTSMTLAPTHKMNEEFKLVNMANKKDLFFIGKIEQLKITGKMAVKDWVGDSRVTKFEDYSGTISCIGVSWVKLDPENKSETH